MRYQRNTHRGSRCKDAVTGEILIHPRPTQHTAESYRTRYVSPGPVANSNRLRRLRRMEKREGIKP